jgi:hypothetical protein
MHTIAAFVGNRPASCRSPAEMIKGEGEQPPLDVETHQSRCHVQADQSGVHALSADQRREICSVVGDEHVAGIDSPAHDRPILARAQPEPGDMRGFSMSASMRKPDERRTQAFVDQEFHARSTTSKAIVSDAFGCRNCHPVQGPSLGALLVGPRRLAKHLAVFAQCGQTWDGRRQ